MEKLDETTASVLRAANVDNLDTLTREDLRDLFPGPENFNKRKMIWHTLHSGDVDQDLRGATVAAPLTSTPATPRNGNKSPEKNPEKTVRVYSPEYVLYTDNELENIRSQYFDLQRSGKEHQCQMSKDLRCRLIRNTITSMISILRAKGDAECHQYPDKSAITLMAKRITEYYPMLKDKKMDKKNQWITVYAQMYKRLRNIRSPIKKGAKRSFQSDDEFGSSDSTVIMDTSSDSIHDSDTAPQTSSPQTSSPVARRRKTFLGKKGIRTDTNLEPLPTAKNAPSTSLEKTGQHSDLGPAAANKVDRDSPALQARHYQSLQALWKKGTLPNKEVVAQLLDLEFEARRAFIDSDAVKEEDRHERILKAYPCFKEIEHVMDELRRILNRDNMTFIAEVKERWSSFFQKAQFYAVSKKILKSPVGTSKVQQAIELLKALPSIFPSSSVPPKKLPSASEAFIHVLEDNEDPNGYLQKRPLSCPVLIVGPSNCILAVGDTPIAAFQKDLIMEGMLYVIALYYTLHLTYPKFTATIFSVIQSEVLLDAVHTLDQTTAFKKALSEWRAF